MPLTVSVFCSVIFKKNPQHKKRFVIDLSLKEFTERSLRTFRGFCRGTKLQNIFYCDVFN